LAAELAVTGKHRTPPASSVADDLRRELRLLRSP
jgi:hypothetical protein